MGCHSNTRCKVFINHLLETLDVTGLAIILLKPDRSSTLVTSPVSCLVDDDGNEPLVTGPLQPGLGAVLRLKHPANLVTTLGTHAHLVTRNITGDTDTGHYSLASCSPGTRCAHSSSPQSPDIPWAVSGSDQGSCDHSHHQIMATK